MKRARADDDDDANAHKKRTRLTVADCADAYALRGIVYAAGNAIKAEDTAHKSNNKRDWVCVMCSHTFTALVYSVAEGRGCPYCAGRKKLCAQEQNCDACITKSVAPQLDAYLERGIAYSAKNIAKPEETLQHSSEMRKWVCVKCSHTFSEACNNVAKGAGCPECGKKQSSSKFGKPVVASHLDDYLKRGIAYSATNVEKAEDTLQNGSEKRDWVCLHCSHTFSTKCYRIADGSGCPFCANLRLCAHEKNCSSCISKTVAFRLDEYLARGITYSAANVAKAEETSLKSSEKREWGCVKCSHTFSAACFEIAKGHGCPYCYNRKWCAHEKKCGTCISKSLASRLDAYLERGITYSAKNVAKAEETPINTTRQREWVCVKCSHSFSATGSIVAKGVGCPYCSDRKWCATQQNCGACIGKSLASRLAAYMERGITYMPTNATSAEDTASQSAAFRAWGCAKCHHTFSATCASVAKGAGCPNCFKKDKIA